MPRSLTTSPATHWVQKKWLQFSRPTTHPFRSIGRNHRSDVSAERNAIPNCEYEAGALRLDPQTCRKGSSDVCGIPIIPFGGFARRLISAGAAEEVALHVPESLFVSGSAILRICRGIMISDATSE